MDNNEYNALRKRVRELRTVAKKARSLDVPAGIQLLRDMLKNSVSDEIYIALSGLLLGEYAVFGMHDEEEFLLREQIKKFPNKPIPQIALADLLVSREDLEQAQRVAETAIITALGHGNFIRDAYNCRARVAVKTKNYKLLEDTLEKLIEYHPSPGSQNVRYETNFLSELPADAVSADVLNTYLKICAQGGRG